MSKLNADVYEEPRGNRRAEPTEKIKLQSHTYISIMCTSKIIVTLTQKAFVIVNLLGLTANWLFGIDQFHDKLKNGAYNCNSNTLTY